MTDFHDLHDDIERRWKEKPLWERVRLRVGWKVDNALRAPARAYSVVLNVYQRARYGYGHRDLWSYDHYLAKQIAKATRELADIAHGYPTEFQEVYGDERGLQEWQKYLRDIADDLEGYTDWDSHRKSNDSYEKGVAAMQRLATKFGSLWD